MREYLLTFFIVITIFGTKHTITSYIVLFGSCALLAFHKTIILMIFVIDKVFAFFNRLTNLLAMNCAFRVCGVPNIVSWGLSIVFKTICCEILDIRNIRYKLNLFLIKHIIYRFFVLTYL